MSTPAEQRELLERHQPYLRYDSHEAYFADDAAIFTDGPGITLQQADGTVLATAGAGLSLALLSRDPYPNTASIRWAKTDALSIHDKNYRARAAALHQQPQYRNVVYGHVVEDAQQTVWLQYWYCYLFNDYNLIGAFLKAGLHEGDWEMVQVRLGGPGHTPDHAVYAQHSHAQGRPWDQVELVPGTERPVVYVARGSHASYFEPGTKWTGVWLDYADGKRQSPERQRLVAVISGDAALRWIRWPGTWGDTKPRGGIAPAESPRSPGVRKHWTNPLALLDVAAVRLATVLPTRPAPPAAPSVSVARTATGAELAWAVAPAADGTLPTLLTVTVNSKDEAAPPATTNVPIAAASGTLSLLDLDPAKRYDIFVSDATAAGVPSESVRRDLTAVA